MSGDVTWLALAAGAASGLIGGLMSFRKDRWITFVVAIGAGMLGGILSNRLLMLTEVVAPRIVLIDSNGVTRAELGVSNQDSARLRLMDRSGNERVRLDAGFGDQGPCFFFKDLHDKTLVAFCVRDDRTAVLDLRGPNGKLLWSSAPAESSAVRPPIYSTEQSHPGNASPRSK
jgi:hypothetical protein